VVLVAKYNRIDSNVLRLNCALILFDSLPIFKRIKGIMDQVYCDLKRL